VVTFIAAYAALVASVLSAGRYVHVQNRRERSLPAELRPLLLRVQKIAADVISSPRDHEWAAENVRPLRDELGPVVALVPHTGRSYLFWLQLVQMTGHLDKIGIGAVSSYDDNQAVIARKTTDQREAARRAREIAIDMVRGL
jgi:hypothetical protein